MAGLSYKRLFNTEVMHDFYVDGISKKDFAFFPTASTALTLKNNNMLYRNDDSGFRILYKVDEAGDPFISFSNLRLTFAMKLLNNTEFLNITDLTGIENTKIRFTNISDETTSVLHPELLVLRPSMFTYPFPEGQVATDPGDVGHIEIKTESGSVVTPAVPDPNSLVPDTNLHFSYPVDLTGLPAGFYIFTTWINSGDPESARFYIDNELAGQSIFGIVDLLAINAEDENYPEYPTPPPSDFYRTYQVSFQRRVTQWKYILVLKSTTITLPTDLTIVDEGEVDDIYNGPLEFTTDPGDYKVNGDTAVVITSDSAAIPYYQIPKKGLTVKKDGVDTVLTNLPNPPLGVVSAEKGPPVNYGITEIFIVV